MPWIWYLGMLAILTWMSVGRSARLPLDRYRLEGNATASSWCGPRQGMAIEGWRAGRIGIGMLFEWVHLGLNQFARF